MSSSIVFWMHTRTLTLHAFWVASVKADTQEVLRSMRVEWMILWASNLRTCRGEIRLKSTSMRLFWGLNQIKQKKKKWGDLSPTLSDRISDSSCPYPSSDTQDTSSPSQLPSSSPGPLAPVWMGLYPADSSLLFLYIFCLFVFCFLSLRRGCQHSTKTSHGPCPDSRLSGFYISLRFTGFFPPSFPLLKDRHKDTISSIELFESKLQM